MAWSVPGTWDSLVPRENLVHVRKRTLFLLSIKALLGSIEKRRERERLSFEKEKSFN